MQNKPDEIEREIQLRPLTWAVPMVAPQVEPGLARALPAIVRAHLVDESQVKSAQQEAVAGTRLEEPYYWPDLVLAFDTETATDEFASLRFGTYIVEWFNPLTQSIERLDAGFFTGEGSSDDERRQIEAYCAAHGLTCLTRRQWLEDILFNVGYRGCGAVVGFNLPFDLSRIATRASHIRLQKPKLKEDGTLKMPGWINKLFAGGWKLVFNEYQKKDEPGQWRERAYRPPVLLKPISSGAAMYRWGFFVNWQDRDKIVKWPYGKKQPEKNEESTQNGHQKQPEKTEDRKQPEKGARFYNGRFLDLRTLGLALSKDDQKNGRQSSSLRALGERFGARVLKTESREHGGRLIESYLDYALNDAEATLSLYYAEMDEYRKHGLNVTPDRIYSGASLGKAYLRQMGIHTPPLVVAESLPYSQDEIFGFGMSAYYAARAEAQIVKIGVPVTYVDFHAMYPTVNILQGLWDIMKAETVRVSDATQEAIEFLKNVQAGDLFDPETWKKLTVLCLIEPSDDIFPVRADYRWRKSQGSSISHRIALAEVASAPPMWYTLADCIASYLSTGKPPRILAALKFSPEGSRPLQPVSIRGGPLIDPNREDFFRGLVEARDALGKDDKRLADALKIVANATGYGIWAELDVEDGERPVTAYSTGQRRSLIPHGEKPGRYYFPPLAAFITSGARLMLKLFEDEIERRGGWSAFCDTDSFAIASSAAGGELAYRDHKKKLHEIPLLTWAEVDKVLRKFESLNPYRSGKPLIKLEPENFEDGDPAKGRAALHAFVIAVKRYCLYIPSKGKGSGLTIVKPSYHTLGIVEPPHDKNGSGIKNWINQFWPYIISRRYFNPPWAVQPVEFHLDIRSPEIWKSFQKLTAKDRAATGNKWMSDYLAGVKPFNFVAVLAKTRVNHVTGGEAETESSELSDVPVIAPLALDGGAAERRWVAKKGGEPVSILPPGKIWLPHKGLSEEELQQRAMAEIHERQTLIKKIEADGGLATTPMTFAEFMADYRAQHETSATDLQGGEIEAATRGRLAHPRVAITELHFTGKESVLQEELENGIVSEEEAESYRFTIRPERDPAAELVIEALRLLSKAELRRLKISRWTADKIKEDDGYYPAWMDDEDLSSFMIWLVKYLQKHYREDVGGVDGEDALHAFMENRRKLLEQWQAAKPRLATVPTQELMKIAGCSRRNAIYIKRGEVEPGIKTIKKIVDFYRV